jgi:hypothetical protein
MTPFRRARIVLPLALAAVACVGPPRFGSADRVWDAGSRPPADWERDQRYRQEGMPRTIEPEPAPVAGEQADPPAPVPLLAWDGGVVDEPVQGAVAQGDSPKGLGPSPAGRMHIIELYQEALDERDQLRIEVGELGIALERADEALGAGAAKSAALEERARELEAEVQRLISQNQDLAARLATAQIRRLEAEKLLLETRLDEHRARARRDASLRATGAARGAEEPR